MRTKSVHPKPETLESQLENYYGSINITIDS